MSYSLSVLTELPLIDQMPSIYRGLLPQVFFDPTPKETIATCHDCIMCKDWEVKKARGEKYFTPQGKCCTYFPSIPNYLVGSLLLDESDDVIDGRSRVSSLITKKIGVTSLGLRSSVLYNKKYKAFSKFNFGLANDLICPLNDRSSGNCTIWPHRNSVCSMWYCKSVGGRTGQEFWREAQQYLTAVEKMLSIYAADQLGINVKHFLSEGVRLQADDMKGNIDQEKYSRIWQQWENREQAFYVECFKVINSLDSETFESRFASRLGEKFQAMNLTHHQFVNASNKS